MAVKETTFRLNPTIPHDPVIKLYAERGGVVTPYEFNGWIPETLSWKESAYLGTFLSGAMPALVLKGKDATRLLDENCVNSFGNMKPNISKHVVMCSEKGNIIAHGMVLCIAENHYVCYALQPLLPTLANSGRYDVDHMDMENFGSYIYQIGGPKSLEILEQAAQEDLHDIKFLHFHNTKIAGQECRILRIGMAGTLSYEVHGPVDGCHDVYNTIFEAGKPFGMQKLGNLAYNICNHTENGFGQSNMHFKTAWEEHQELMENLSKYGSQAKNPLGDKLLGSYSDKVEDYYMNPIELGWGKLINYKKDFVGKGALEAIKNRPHRHPVTLLWNVEDVVNVYASQFGDRTVRYRKMWMPTNLHELNGGNDQDRVEDALGNVVGVSSGRVYTEYSHDMISMGIVNEAHTELGKELFVIWGHKGQPQKKIRVTVSRFPYLDLPTNQDFDMDSIPRFLKK